jgi:hypothetical protein
MSHISVCMLAQVSLPRIPFLYRDVVNHSVHHIAILLRILLTGKEPRVILNGASSVQPSTWAYLSAHRMSHHERRADLQETSLGRSTPSLLAALSDLGDLVLLLLVVPEGHDVVWVVLELSPDVLDVLGGQDLRKDTLVRGLLPPLLLSLLMGDVEIILLKGRLG